MKNKENQPTTTRMTHEPSKSSRLRWRWVLLVGLVVLTFILISFRGGSSQASSDKNVSAPRNQIERISRREYQFTGQGKILAGTAATWVIGGVPILTRDQTKTEGTIHPGDSVSLVGHITENGTWVAEWIVPIAEEDSFFSFAGPLESKDKDSWQVAGVPLAIDDHTYLGDSIPMGELVVAIFQVQPDGTWLALQIQSLAVLERQRTPTVTPTPTPTATSTPTPKSTPTPPPTPAPAIQNPPSSDHNSQNDLVTVCHKPNHKKGGKTLVLDRSALNGHLKHGDTLGACQ